MLRVTTSSFAIALSFMINACADPPPAKMTPSKGDDGVAANSASEQRLGMNKPAPAPTETANDPTQPLTTPLNADPNGTSAPGSTTSTAASAAGKNGKPGKGPKEKDPKGAAAAGGGGKVSKAECKQLFDKYIDLTVSTDSRFADIPPEMIAQLKQSALSQAQSEKGDPCATQDVTRAQYNCAIAAPTTAAWQRCMPK